MLCAVAGIVVAGCGSDSKSSSTTAASGASTTQPAASTPATTTGGSATPATTGAPSNDRAGQTIKIGFVNEDAGAFSFPEMRVGGELAIKHINDTGGINGAKLEAVSCSTNLTPESSIDCANKLIEAGVVLSYTAIDLTSDAALPVYQEAKIPYVTTDAWGGAQANADGSHLLHMAGQAWPVAAFALMQELGLTKVGLLYEESQAATDFVDNTKPIAEKMGITLQAVGVDASAPDWNAAVATAQAGGAQVLYGQFSEAGCTGLVGAALSANFSGPVIAGTCSSFIKEFGDKSVGVYTLHNTLLPSMAKDAPTNVADHLNEYVELMKADGHGDTAEGAATMAFSGVMELSEILSSISGDVTAQSVEAALSRDVDVPGWLGPDINCGAHPWPAQKSHCSATASIWQVGKADDGTLTRNLVMAPFDAYAFLQKQ
ncbi:MAG: ABC transporter substrate-binding protein [Ilumatobacteraceae bacterium]